MHMKRGIFRIIAGAVLVLLQLYLISDPSIIDPSYPYRHVGWDLSFAIGFFSFGIVGAILLHYGIRACRHNFRSKLILHSTPSKPLIVTKWVFFGSTVLLLAFNVYRVVFSFYALFSFPFFNLFMFFATLSFALYLLIYVHKKPTCLFSTALIFTGIAYLYNLVDGFPLILEYSETPTFSFIFIVVPQFVSGILYIAIAATLYKENFSISVVKVLGWIVFGLELTAKVLSNMLSLKNLLSYFTNIGSLLFLMLPVAFFLYISIFDINTLQKSNNYMPPTSFPADNL